MILDGANVLILDEPTRNFSPLSNPVIRRILREFRGCILSISHDRKYISQVCDTIYELTPRGLSQVFGRCQRWGQGSLRKGDENLGRKVEKTIWQRRYPGEPV